ncbi:hypothetical protein DVH24_010726 [Malus domestica]|uniref:Uncharacterized protein n=1 Tax=Malus domestica TaxID=3750 RepID=A0A498JZ06_MALDO|nr:hypothetical protein DVH24_010726 [Malus domestica]
MGRASRFCLKYVLARPPTDSERTAKPPTNPVISLLLRTFAHQPQQLQLAPRPFAPSPFPFSFLVTLPCSRPTYKQLTTDLYRWRWYDHVSFVCLAFQWNDVVHGYLQHNGHLGFLRSRGFVSYSSGDKKETLAPLVFFGTTGTMLDIIMGITQCEREHAEHQAKLLEDQTSATDASFAEIGAE